MIQLNGHQERFFAASGSLGFDGLDEGHPLLVKLWKLPFRWSGHLDPRRLTVVTKTLTALPRRGHLGWDFWRAAWCLRPLTSRSMVNAVALTNPGLDAWIQESCPRAKRRRIRLIASIAPDTVEEAVWMAATLQERCPELSGVQVNYSCPNVHLEGEAVQVAIRSAVAKVEAVLENCELPVMVKHGVHQPWIPICRRLDGRLAANVLINAVPFLYFDGGLGLSPLARYGYDGSVSGGQITTIARTALKRYRFEGFKTPVVSGGGLVSCVGQTLEEEVRRRFGMGADAVEFGTAYLWEPWGPGRVMRALDKPSLDKRHREYAL